MTPAPASVAYVIVRASPADIGSLVGPAWDLQAAIIESLNFAVADSLEYYRKLGYVWWAGPDAHLPLAYAVAYENKSAPKRPALAVTLHALVKAFDPMGLEAAQWLMAHLLQPAVLGSVNWYTGVPVEFKDCELAVMLQHQFRFVMTDGWLGHSLMLSRYATGKA